MEALEIQRGWCLSQQQDVASRPLDLRRDRGADEGTAPAAHSKGFVEMWVDHPSEYGYSSHMKTTVEIDDDLLQEVSKLYRFRTKRETIEAGLRELIAAHKRKALAGMFGGQKNIKVSPRKPA